MPVVSSWCRGRPFPPDFAGKTPAAGVHSFPYCPNMETNVPIFASSHSFPPLLRPDLVKFSVFGCFGPVLLLSAGWSRHGGRGARRRCRSPSVRCSARNIGRRATLLPSPRRRSFLSVMVSGWWSPFCSGVLLLRVSRWGFWCSFLPCWVWLYTGVYSSLFNRARNKRARTREGLPLLFPVSLPSAGLLTAFFFGGRCRGIPSTPGKRGGAFLFDFYIYGGIVKNLHGRKISTAGAVLVPSWRCWFGLLRLSAHGCGLGQLEALGLPWNSPAHA